MKRQITSDRLRQPSGVFSHATTIEARGKLVFISGMVSRRADGTIAGIGDIEAQTRQVCENLKVSSTFPNWIRSLSQMVTMVRSERLMGNPS